MPALTPAALTAVVLGLAAGLAVLAAATLALLLRASRARRELAASIHDHALALDRRCDVLRDQIGTLAERQRIEHLFDLVTLGEAEGELPPPAVRRLRRYVLELRSESFREADDI